MPTTAAGPPRSVRDAFGATGPVVAMASGQGDSWRCGALVLKSGTWPALQEWLGTVVSTVPRRGFRLAEPRRGQDGRWVVDGWSAHVLVPGARPLSAGRRWHDVVAAGRAFHDAVAALPRAALVDQATGPWAAADRGAWGEQRLDVHPRLSEIVVHLSATAGETPPGPAQVVHGDLTGNVLDAPGGAPVIIDISPYWRPPAYAEGVVVADAVTWHGAPATLTDELEVGRSAVARGLLFRVLTTSERHRRGGSATALGRDADHYARAVEVLGL
ncbi:MAG: TIGR02569 family protein [Phycicoccus sp.]